MAPTKLVVFTCLLLLNICLAYVCNADKGCLIAGAASSDIYQSRKVLYVLGGKNVVLNMHAKTDDGLVGKNLDKWEELRRVPAGPDPLHHNDSGPKKPRNSP